MIYTRPELDRSTGELITVSKGDWITITELGKLHGVTRIKVRAILRKMDFLYVPGGGAHQRHRLSPWVVQRSFGKFIPARPGPGGPHYPFDVISPEGREWIEERWEKTVSTLDAEANRHVVAEASTALQCFQEQRLSVLNVHGQVLWLRDRFPILTHAEIGVVTGVSQPIVSRYIKLRDTQLKARKAYRDKPVPELGPVKLRLELDDDPLPSGGARYITHSHNITENVTLTVSRDAAQQAA